jgi:hypothetical protein
MTSGEISGMVLLPHHQVLMVHWLAFGEMDDSLKL